MTGPGGGKRDFRPDAAAAAQEPPDYPAGAPGVPVESDPAAPGDVPPALSGVVPQPHDRVPVDPDAPPDRTNVIAWILVVTIVAAFAGIIALAILR